jgi:hypothetical protein
VVPVLEEEPGDPDREIFVEPVAPVAGSIFLLFPLFIRLRAGQNPGENISAEVRDQKS